MSKQKPNPNNENESDINQYMESLDDIPTESVITQYGDESKDNEALDAVEAWMPKEGEMKDETILDPSQIRGMAAARTLPQYFSKLISEEFAQALHSQLDDYEKYAVSEDGKGREEQVDVLRGVFGRGRTQDGEGEGSVNVFANPEEQ